MKNKKNYILLTVAIGLLLITAAFFKLKAMVWVGEEDTLINQAYVTINERTNNSRYLYFYTPTEGNYVNKTYLFLPAGIDINEVNLHLSIADHVVFTKYEDESDEVTIKDDAVMKGVEADTQYVVSFMDKSDNIMEQDIVCTMQSEGIPTLFVDSSSGNFDNINADKTYTETGSMYLMDESGKQLLKEKLKYIKGHGNTSWEIPKKTYQIKLDYAAELLGMENSDKWILQSNGLDYSYIHNSVVYDMGRSLGMPGTADLKYVELYLNGMYHGLYQIEGKAEVAETRLNIQNLDSKNYLKNINSEVKGNYKLVSENRANGVERSGYDIDDADDITGGYLVEHDYGAKYGSETCKFKTENGECYVLKSPQMASLDEVNYIADFMQNVENLITAGDESVNKYIDVENFADKYILEEFVRNDGAGTTSSYFYKDSDSIDPYMYAGPIWDYDKTFGKNSQTTLKDPNTLSFLTSHVQHTMYFYDLYTKNSEFLNYVKKDYKEKFLPYIETITADGGVIDKYAKIVAGNKKMDCTRWNIGEDEKDNWIQDLKDYINERTTFLNKIWIDNADMCIVYFPMDNVGHCTYIGIEKGTKLRYLPYFPHKKVDYWYDQETGKVVDEDTVITKDMTVLAKLKDQQK
ncbi:MAG: CotH kinase family protein [Lachnospiraceae bacterium]|nr:CotH kinase family protein [Lachnospiraceae bacterium]